MIVWREKLLSDLNKVIMAALQVQILSVPQFIVNVGGGGWTNKVGEPVLVGILHHFFGERNWKDSEGRDGSTVVVEGLSVGVVDHGGMDAGNPREQTAE